MRKHLFFLAAGALALTACTSEDVIDDVASTRNVIQFENVVNNLTRAEDLTNTNLTQFNVFGFYTMIDNANYAHQIFNNEAVTKEGADWTYSGQSRSWVPGAQHYFYAYSCGNVSKLGSDYGTFKVDMEEQQTETSTGKPAEQRKLEILNYLCDYTHQHDLVFATYQAEGKPTGDTNDPVTFTFNHILSKLQAKFTTTLPEEYTVVIKNVQISNIYNKGTYKWDEQYGWVWSDQSRPTNDAPMVFLQNTKGTGNGVDEGGNLIKDPELTVTNSTVDVTVNDQVVSQQLAVPTKYAYVIPNNHKQGDVLFSFEIDVMVKGNYTIKGKTLSAVLQPDWKQGCWYTYNVNIDQNALSLQGITFQVDVVNRWDDDQPFNGNLTAK